MWRLQHTEEDEMAARPTADVGKVVENQQKAPSMKRWGCLALGRGLIQGAKVSLEGLNVEGHPRFPTVVQSPAGGFQTQYCLSSETR